MFLENNRCSICLFLNDIAKINTIISNFPTGFNRSNLITRRECFNHFLALLGCFFLTSTFTGALIKSTPARLWKSERVSRPIRMGIEQEPKTKGIISFETETCLR